MIGSAQLRAPAKLLTLFVLLAGVPLAALGWLGWRLLDQDRALDRQRLRERLANDAALLAQESDRAFARWEMLLAAAPGAPPAGSTFLIFNAGGLLRQKGLALPYYPESSVPAEAPVAIFSEAETQEFRENALTKAAAAYRRLALTTDRPQRAAALMRLARCLRKQHQFADALSAYAELAALGDISVAGVPAELLARRERIAIWKFSGDEDAVRRETALLTAALQQCRFRIDRATFDFYRQSTPDPPILDSNTAALARAVDNFWPRWRREPSGRAVLRIDDAVFAAAWHQTSAETETAAIAGPLDALLEPVSGLARILQVRITLEDSTGRLLAGLPPESEHVSKIFRETGLPWTIQVSAASPDTVAQTWKSRRNLFAAGLALMALVIATAAYFVYRSVHRELGVARLQSDFVSAVSHEFRTPLTAMCHLTEMLEDGAASQDRLPQYYSALARETRRLHGMVESLLDFGRMEAGRRTYHMEETDAAELVREIVDEFRGAPSVSADRLALRISSNCCIVRADREAIALALRNLLDNAVKYSPESSPVEVFVAHCGDFTGISVEDRGPGIPKEEQRAVFRKFVRGETARKLNVKGTGIGLALADHIVKAHGGRLELDSEPGRGSRFTILLPAHPNHQ